MGDPLSKFRHPRINSAYLISVCESTQTWAKKHAETQTPLPDTTLFIAEEQTRGAGRQGRIWHSPRGGLWLSLLLKPQFSPEKSQALSAAASLGILEGILQITKAPCRLKWPNDILLEGKKLGGVIVETSLRGPTLEWVVIGAGININNPLPPELMKTATTLSQWKGEDLDPALILTSVLNGFFEVYDRFLREGFSGIQSSYLKRLQGLGSTVRVEAEGKTYRGIALNVDLEGRLVVQLDQQRTRPFSSSEAHLVGPSL